MSTQKTSTLAIAAILALAILPSAVADDDNIPDVLESELCGVGLIQDTLDGSNPIAGECVSSTDYENAILDGLLGAATCGVEFCTRSLVSLSGIGGTPGHTVSDIPVPVEDVPSHDPEPTDPVDVSIVSVHGDYNPDQPEEYCIWYVLESGFSDAICFNPLDATESLFEESGPHELVFIAPIDLGPTPGYEQGELYNIEGTRVPSASLDVDIDYSWNEERLNRRVGNSMVSYYEAIDYEKADEQAWWMEHGDETNVSIRIVLNLDDASTPVLEQDIPMAGQLVAATLKTLAIA